MSNPNPSARPTRLSGERDSYAAAVHAVLAEAGLRPDFTAREAHHDELGTSREFADGSSEPLLVRIGRDFTAAGIAPDAQLARVNASPRWMQNALWRDLREHIDRERAT